MLSQPFSHRMVIVDAQWLHEQSEFRQSKKRLIIKMNRCFSSSSCTHHGAHRATERWCSQSDVHTVGTDHTPFPNAPLPAKPVATFLLQ
ncbi:hypothetical protein ACOMHN_052405 [Nucella lapillus]